MQISIPETSAGVQIFALASVLTTAGALLLFLVRVSDHGARRGVLLFAGLFALYYTALGFAAHGGHLADFSAFPPRILFPLVFLPLCASIYIVLSSGFGRLLAFISPVHLTLFQIYRIFAEILIAWLVIEQAMPETMTVTGRNFDLFAPLTAPVAASFFARSNQGRFALAALFFWNMAASLILANTVATAVLSMPTPGRVFFDGPPVVIPAVFPFYLLPAFYVPLAFAVHAASFRKIVQLWPRRKAAFETLQAQ